ncbi:ribosomal RNA small subunit methyltransferase-like [Rutidosis leptorrhynchoides]|uniref:ribosomal RNA small subunit methyltransferase-like n=1 Tax=Rutidosis leptorrhynchoides TaxID=125765 RepID=UPI003A995B3A
MRNSIKEKVGIYNTDVVLEIGPGTGNLTKKLLKARKTIIAVELDPRMVHELEHLDTMHLWLEEKLRRRSLHVVSMRNSIKEKAGIYSTDVVLEIGPGTGNLTKKLLEARKTVIAIELDPRMVRELERLDTMLRNQLKIEPRKPVPVNNLKELGGLVQIYFIRKNKTLGAIFKIKSVLSVMEKNYKTLQALQLSHSNDN